MNLTLGEERPVIYHEGVGMNVLEEICLNNASNLEIYDFDAELREEIEQQLKNSKSLDDYDHVEACIIEINDLENSDLKEANGSLQTEIDHQQIDNLIQSQDISSPKVELTYYQRKMKQYEEDCLKSFGGGLGDIEIKPKLSKIQQEK